MNDEPLVSIFMLCYNHEKYIKKSIESILSQSVDFKIEIIIHDDASTDRSPEIISTYEKKHPNLFKVIYQKENQYSKGIDLVREYIWPCLRGKYVAMCECDDFWCSTEKLQKQIDFLESHPEIIGCTNNCNIIDDDDNIIGNSYSVYHFCKTHLFDIKRFECGLFPGQTAAIVYRKSAIVFSSKDQENDYCSIRCQGDQKLALHLLLNGKIWYLEDIMSSHRVVFDKGNSWTARVANKDMALYMFCASRDLRHYAKKYYHYTLHNHYVTFHRCLHLIINRIKRKPNSQLDYKLMINEVGSSFYLFFYLTAMLIRSFPFFIIQKNKRNKFDLKK